MRILSVLFVTYRGMSPKLEKMRKVRLPFRSRARRLKSSQAGIHVPRETLVTEERE